MSILDFFNKRTNMDNIYVCIGNIEEKSDCVIPFVNNLVLYFVENQNDSYKILTNSDIKKMDISKEELLAIAKENIKKKIYSMYKEIPLRKNEDAEVVIPFDADIILEKRLYNFWTSLVLIDEFWNKESANCINKKWDKYYIAMPYRTFLIVGNADNKKSLEEIKKIIEDYSKQDKNELFAMGDIEAAKRSISNDIYVMENNKLTLYK